MWSLRSSTLASSAAVILSLSPTLLHAQTTPSSEEQALRQRVEDLERQLKQLEERFNQQAKPEAPAGAQPSQPVEAAKPAEPSPQEQAMQKQINELNQQVKSLEEIQQQTKVIPAQKAEAPAQAGVRQGISITSPNGDLQLRFRALLQVDYRDYLDQEPPNTAVNSFILRRVRPILEGTAYEKFDFRFTPDFGNSTVNGTTTQSIPQIYDAYMDANLYPEFKVRVGKFKPPLGLERLQSAGDLLFAERAFPTLLVPNRDIGLMVFGDVLDRRLFYAAGVFNGAVDNAMSQTGDANNGKDFDLRLYTQPWINTSLKALRGLGVGIAYSRGSQQGTGVNPQLPTYLTPGQQAFFSYAAGAQANGERVTWAPQLYYSVGPLGVLAEYTNTAQFVTRSTNTQNVSNNAWQVALSWVLTGEDASFRGVIPTNNFNLKKGTWGDLELVARISKLSVDSNAFVGSAATQLAVPTTQANKATDYGIGLGWDLSREVRIMLDYDQTTFKGGMPNGGDRPDEKVLITRFQYSL
jgi:phosphate-selective porin OprO/OprP